MKLIHLSDLHLGKRVNEYSMIADQQYILEQILNLVKSEKPDALLIAGDVYDKSIPTAEAVELFDFFLVKLAKLSIRTFIISGNHDSAERLSFGGRLMDKSGIHFAPVYDGHVEPISISDEYGDVNIYLLPFIKPVHVRNLFPEEEISTYTDAVKIAIKNMNINDKERNILVTHQFVTGADRCESEEISVGGTDNVDAYVFDAFDYVALGHIHSPQNIGSERIRYCGTPLKYSFSEAKHKKSITVVELGEKGNLNVKAIELKPVRDMVELKGTYGELTAKSYYENKSIVQDYVHITLTDENVIPDALAKLRSVYSNIMRLDYDNARTRHKSKLSDIENAENKSPMELFQMFYEAQNGSQCSQEQKDFVEKLIEKIWEDN